MFFDTVLPAFYIVAITTKHDVWNICGRSLQDQEKNISLNPNVVLHQFSDFQERWNCLLLEKVDNQIVSLSI